MFPISPEILDKTARRLAIVDISSATIRQIAGLSEALEKEAEEKFIHLELGNPGLPSNAYGVEAECAALRNGVANRYPDIAGMPVLKNAGSRFIKSFLDVDIPPKCIVPTVGSMQGSFTMMLLLKQRIPGRDKMLFINPGFPAQRHQGKILGMKSESFDIYEYRGKKLEAKLESILGKGDVTGLIYSNPNNPAWTNLTEEELEIIGRMATKYDVIVLEDLAYMGMDFRLDLGHPGEPPYVPTVAKYTDNYVLLISASKIFSYAGQRIAMVAMSEKVYNRQYKFFEEFYEMPAFGDAYIFGVLYTASSGTAHSTQYAMAAMLDAASDGALNFVEDTREYGRRAGIVKRLLHENGFHIVYAMDGDDCISDGFFFTAGYKDMTGAELQRELMRYGISAISLDSTGSEQNGVRICVSMISDDVAFKNLETRLKAFQHDH
ncbi:MAG: pyridoxal phosphate-dependent aminotransferase [Prevotella sp.]|nr:pyridoxal phosphate-dependent aminotransferase [Bacteroides sp.]MCM1365773.1 pyridoxal phosphate-dependent aminotransferase [Prevotella sp.]MCM1436535.1 pyridoxal phosphate-dependent aminotransferase [Prevotella sp.]